MRVRLLLLLLIYKFLLTHTVIICMGLVSCVIFQDTRWSQVYTHSCLPVLVVPVKRAASSSFCHAGVRMHYIKAHICNSTFNPILQVFSTTPRGIFSRL